jgi:hypothetical protein
MSNENKKSIFDYLHDLVDFELTLNVFLLLLSYAMIAVGGFILAASSYTWLETSVWSSPSMLDLYTWLEMTVFDEWLGIQKILQIVPMGPALFIGGGLLWSSRLDK